MTKCANKYSTKYMLSKRYEYSLGRRKIDIINKLNNIEALNRGADWFVKK